MNSTRFMAVLSVACILGSTLLLIRAADLAFHWEMEWGPLGTWFGGTLTAVAVGTALYTVTTELSQRSREDAMRADRALRRAHRVTVTVSRLLGENRIDTHPRTGWNVELHNGSEMPIYDVEWSETVAARRSGEPLPRYFIESVSPGREFSVLEPKTRAYFNGHATSRSDVEDSHLYVAVMFTDDEGYRFCFDVTEFGELQSPRYKWSHKTKDRVGYPRDQQILAPIFAAADRAPHGA
jgi:hypothetical protein